MLKQEAGILLLAIGHPYYGRMAFNLAISIKAKDPAVHITLIYDEIAIAHINHRYMHVFDNKIGYDGSSGINEFGAKLELDLYTPYERTLFMDVDTLWVNKDSPAKLLDKLKGTPFTGITEGMHDYKDPTKSELNKVYPTWADLDEINQVFFDGDANGKIYQWRSEFIYFESKSGAETVFERAGDVYARAHELKTLKKFADRIPDELALNISCALLDVHPHTYKWKPTYWDRLHGGNMTDIGDLQANYYVISCGSNYCGGALKRTYDRVCAASASRLGLQHVFPLVNKKEMMTNRQQM